MRPSWDLLEDIEFTKLGKLNYVVEEATDYKKFGFLRYVDKAQDRINPKTELSNMLAAAPLLFFPAVLQWACRLRACSGRPLQEPQELRDLVSVTASEDPILQELDDTDRANVFATDDVLSMLMAASRSFYSWDVLVRKQGNKIYFDKRPNSAVGSSSNRAVVSGDLPFTMAAWAGWGDTQTA